MHNLYDDLPTTIEIDGKSIGIDLSFNNVIEVIATLRNNKFSEGQRVILCLHKLLDEVPKYEPSKLVELWVSIYDNFIKVKDDIEEVVHLDIKGNPMPKPSSSEGEEETSFDLLQDTKYIFSSFMQVYSINLLKERNKLHWYEFNALLNGLPDKCKLKEVIKIRTMKIPPIGKTQEDREHRQNVIAMKKAYALKEVE